MFFYLFHSLCLMFQLTQFLVHFLCQFFLIEVKTEPNAKGNQKLFCGYLGNPKEALLAWNPAHNP